MAVVEFIVGFVLLLAGADILVRGAIALARRMGFTPLVIGLTVIAFGTSAPEWTVGVIATLKGNMGIAVGNVVGSNIANILLILGIGALIRPLRANPTAMLRQGGLLLAATTVFIILAWSGHIAAMSGWLMLALLIAFILFSYWSEHRRASGPSARQSGEAQWLPRRPWAILAAIAFGLAVVIAGAELLIDGAILLARWAGLPESAIALTLIAAGSSLPEIATAIAASRHGHDEIAVGTVLGSNVFNLLGVLGTAAALGGLAIPAEILAFDQWVMLAVTALIIPLVMTGHRIDRREAVVMLIAYTAYLAVHFAGSGRIASI